MPLINLTNNIDHDICQILAIMQFPNDEIKRAQYQLINQTNNDLKDRTKSHYLLTSDEIDLLLNSPSYQEFQKLVGDGSKKAYIVGDLIASIYIMDIFKIPEPSFKKAIHISEQFALTQDGRYGDGTRMKYSHQTIRNYWDEYLGVAHLWGALRLNQAYQISANPKVFSENGFIPFLEVASGLLNFGQRFVPSRQKIKTPLLNGDVWTLPESITPRGNLVNAQFPDLLVKLLEGYRA